MMKKNFFKFVIVVSILLCIISAGYVAAQVTLEPPIKNELGEGLVLKGIIEKIISVIFGLGLMVCPIAIVWGGFEIATAQGQEAKITKGKQIILYSIVGLVIIALSMVLSTAVKSVLE